MPDKNDVPEVKETQSDQGGGKPDKSNNQKMGLERFLQLKPQQDGITALLRLKHKADVKTMSDWGAVVEELLKQKVK